MKSSWFTLAKKFLFEQHRYRRWQRVVAALAAVVVFATTYMLILPAITLEKEDSSNEIQGTGTVPQTVESIVGGEASGDETESGDAVPAVSSESSDEQESGIMALLVSLMSEETPEWTLSINSGGDYTLTFTGTGEIPANFMAETAELAEYADLISKVIISEGITAVGEAAFQNNTVIRTVEFKEGSALTTIGSAAFSGCTALTSVNLEACTQLKTIDNSVADALNDVSLLYAGAFYNTGITSITLPASLEFLDSCTFYNCKQLKEVRIEEESQISTLGFSVFGQCSALESINLEACQEDSISLLRGTLYWERGMFNGCSSLKSVTIPHGFGADADNNYFGGFFRGCTALESIVFEENNHITGTSYQLEAFIDSACTSLRTLDLTPLKALTTITSSAFSGINCTTVMLPASLTVLEDRCFASSPNLANVVFEEGSKLKEMTRAFYNCTSLKEMDLSELTALETLGHSSFMGCTALKSVSLPSSLKYIGHDAFNGCVSLQEFIYNASKLVIDSGSENRSCTDIFKDVNSGFTLTINAQNMSVLPAAILREAAGRCGDVLFTGASWLIQIQGTGDGEIGLPEPLCSLQDGYYYIDSYGALYHMVKEYSNYADKEQYVLHLVYCPPGLTEFQPTWTISSNSLGAAYLEAIDPYAFSLSKNLQSVTIYYPWLITTVGEYAFYGCESLEELIGIYATISGGWYYDHCDNVKYATTSTGTLLEGFFPYAGSVPQNAFYNTGLKGTETGAGISGTKSTAEKIKVGDYLTIGVSGYEYLTGESATVSIGISGQLADQEEKKYRVYFECGEGCIYTYDSYLDQTFNIEYTDSSGTVYKLPIKLQSTEVPNVHYYEFPAAATGTTASFILHYAYENYTAGGTIHVWAVEGTADTFGENEGKVIATGDDSQYYELSWSTNPNEFIVTKGQNPNITPALRLLSDGKIGVKDLSYSIAVTRSGTVNEGKGSDIIKSIEFRDKLTLPDGMSYREGLTEAIAAGNYGYTVSEKSVELYVTINNTEYIFCTLSNLSNILSDMSLELDSDGNPVVYWKVLNSATETEISGENNILTYGSEVLIVSDLVVEGEDLEISNELDTTEYYTFSEKQTAVGSAAAVINSGTGDINVTKTKDTEVNYMGEDVQYTITIENPSPYSYKVKGMLSDDLRGSLYLKPENMEAMLDGPGGSKLRITITNAQIGLPADDSVTTVDGATQTTVSAQNTGADIPYNGMATEDTSIAGTAKLVLSKASDGSGYVLEYQPSSGSSQSMYIGSGKAYASIKEALDSVGYIINNNTYYSLNWNYTDTVLLGGEKIELTYTATVKNSFMLLENDKQYYYNENGTYISNEAHMYDDGKHPGSLYSPNLARELEVHKDVSRNGEFLGESFVVEDGEVLDYIVSITHSGSGTYDLLPVVDHMSGMQVLLVPVSDNESRPWAGTAPVYKDADGISYYVLISGSYDGVWIDGKYADSVTVSTNAEGTGLDTIIKWYYKDTIPSAFSTNTSYKALVSAEYTQISADIFTIGNEVWLNDHQTHRLYDVVGGGGSVISFNKKIVDEKGTSPDEDVLNEEDFSKVNRGDRVTYRLRFSNSGGEMTLSGKDIYDTLPKNGWWDGSDELFKWSKNDNVSISYVTDGDAAVINPDSWGITYDITGTDYTARQQYIKWNDEFQINYTGAGSVYIYVTLQFPEDAEVWKKYCSKNGSERLVNMLHMYEFSDSVSHELVDKGMVLLQKGVYETGLYSYDFSSTGETALNKSIYAPGANRFYYANQDVNKRTVSYYVVIRNSGNNRLYLSDIYDELPEGFVFYTLNNRTDDGWGGVRGNVIYTYANGDQYVKVPAGDDFVTIDNSKHIGAVVNCKPLGTVNGHNMVKFTITDGRGDGYEELGYDESVDRYYLEPNEYIQFGYTALTGLYENSLDEAVNTIAMEYYDYNNTGVEADTSTEINVSTNNKQSENNGSRELLTNDEAVSHSFTTGNENSQWLASAVTVTRGEIVPGITKTVNRSTASPTDTVKWTIKASNSGELSITDYSIKDTMQKPYRFTGDVVYGIEYKTDNQIKHLAPASGALFSFGDRPDDDTSISITSNTGKSYPLTVNGAPVSVEVNWSDSSEHTTLINIEVSLSRDDETGSETLLVHFPDYRMAIPENGYGELTISTKNLTDTFASNVYVNEAFLIPERQEYDRERITQGNNVTDEDGNNAGVRNSSFVNVATSYFTTSLKTITEKVNADNTASSDQEVNYILLDGQDKTFTYTLSVQNENDKAISELVLIDNLPETGDHNTLVSTDERYSEFNVSLAENPNFKVIVGDTVLDSNQYTIAYSKKTEFPSTANDWTSSYMEGWDAESADARSVRLIIKDSRIPANTKVSLSFDAMISGDAPSPGETAWNSFGYSYRVGELTLFAAPLKVGLRIPSIPKLSKSLVNTNGNAVEARQDETFGFIIYAGDKTDFADYRIDTIAKALYEQNRSWTYKELTVKKGEAASEAESLSGLKKYSYTDSGPEETNEAWSWENGNYNIIEVDFDGKYDYKSTNSMSGRNYSFFYESTQNQTIKYVNERPAWEIVLTKTDTEENLLPGALFGLYSTDPSEAMSEEEAAAFKADYALSDDFETVIESGILNRTTYYLCDIQQSPESGIINWTALGGDGYIVRELKAPDGYYFTENDYCLEYNENEDIQSLTVENKAGIELPATGGSGFAGILRLLGGLVMTAAACCMVILKRKRARK